MIHLSRLHDAGSIVINADLIETIEACPDTTITLMTKRKFVVADALDNVVDKIVEYRRRLNVAVANTDVVAEPAPGGTAAPATAHSLDQNDRQAA